jgi:hypothetical protein
MRNQPRGAASYGIDIGKNVFHVVGLDQQGRPVQRAKFSAPRSSGSLPMHRRP